MRPPLFKVVQQGTLHVVIEIYLINKFPFVKIWVVYVFEKFVNNSINFQCT